MQIKSKIEKSADFRMLFQLHGKSIKSLSDNISLADWDFAQLPNLESATLRDDLKVSLYSLPTTMKKLSVWEDRIGYTRFAQVSIMSIIQQR